MSKFKKTIYLIAIYIASVFLMIEADSIFGLISSIYLFFMANFAIDEKQGSSK